MKEQIIEAALARFLKDGIRSLTIKKLVEPMGISTKTVYKYFDGKEALLEECLGVHYKALAVEFGGIAKRYINPVHALLGIFRSMLAIDFGVNHLFYHDLNHYYPQLQSKVIEKHGKLYAKVLTGIIGEGMREGYFDSNIHTEVVLAGMGLLYTSITRSDQYKRLKLKPAVLFANLVEPYIKGICTEQGLAQIKNI